MNSLAVRRLSALALAAGLMVSPAAQTRSSLSLNDLVTDAQAAAAVQQAAAAQQAAMQKEEAERTAAREAAAEQAAEQRATAAKARAAASEATMRPPTTATPIKQLPTEPEAATETFVTLGSEHSGKHNATRAAAKPSQPLASLAGLVSAAPDAPAPNAPPPEPPAALPATMAAASNRPVVNFRRPDKQPPAAPPPTPASIDPNARNGLKPVAPVHAWTPTEGAPVPDRWRLVNDLALLKENPLDPYNQNTLKGDKPVHGADEFLTVSLIADSIWEPRKVPTPVGAQASTKPGELDIFGGPVQDVYATSAILSLVYIKGDTAFKPPEYELHFTPVFNFNAAQVEESRALRVDPRESRTRRQTFIGVQELFLDYHLRNVSDRFDFDSVRFGIQPISLDFRGFLFQDLPLSLRLFGNRDNNFYQYNVLWARRLEKDTNSGLNAINRELRNDDVFAVNLYKQDWPVVGFVSQATIVHNVNREGQEVFYNNNGFIERPTSFGLEKGRNYQVTYLGLNGDGHFGRTNVTASTYLALGRESRGTFTDRPRQIVAGFGAVEASWDFDWTRLRLSGLYATGDKNPYSGTANGFDAINELPLFAGADTNYWTRQSVPLIGGGGVAITTRNGQLNNLRSSIQHGQSNFANPGTVLLGVGSDFDITPSFRISTNANYLRFADSTVVEVARNQGHIPNEIGYDLSVATIWRPFATQNIVIRTSYAELIPGDGYKQLFPHERSYSFLANLIFTY